MRILLPSIALLLACDGASPKPVDDSCATEADCTNPALPYCVDATCHACSGVGSCSPETPRCSPADLICTACLGDLDCNGYPSMSRCNAADGSCVECLESAQCPDSAPVCDPVDHTCNACSSDDDCASAVCDRTTGACISESAVLYASPTGAVDAVCTKAAPCSFQKAVDSVDAARVHIKLAGGIYLNGARIAGLTTLAIHGLGATVRNEIIVQDGATVRIDDLEIDTRFTCVTTTTTAPIPTVVLDHVTLDTADLQPCNLDIRNSRLTPQSQEQPIRARADAALRPSNLQVDRSVITGGEGMCIYESSYHFKNTVISNLTVGAGVSAFVCITFTQPPGNTVEFTTFYNAPLECTDGPLSLTVSNSIIFSDRSAVDVASGTKCVHHYNLLNPQAAAIAGSNNLLGMDPRLADVALGNFHLMQTSPAIDAGDPSVTPIPDFDGTARPQGIRADLGAFEFVPVQ